MLRKIVSALILVPLAVILIAFAVANRQIVTVSLDPFNTTEPAASLTLPLFALVIVLLVIGVIVGGMAAWLRQSKWRRTARRLERELGELRARADGFEGSTAGSGIVPRQDAVPERLKLKPPIR